MRYLLTILLACALSPAQMLQSITNYRPSTVPTTVAFGNYTFGSGNVANLAMQAWGGAPSAGNGELVLIWHPNGTTIATVCNGTGTDGCTGSDTYTSLGTYANATNFISDIFLVCNITITTAPTITPNATTNMYAEAIWFSGQTTTGGATGCNDGGGPINAQSTSTSTALVAGTITTTNAHSLLLGLFTNDSGSGTYSTPLDNSAGSAMTFACGNGTCVTGVPSITYLQESVTGSFAPRVTYGSAVKWNAQTVAIK